ncbi:hypothetical protein MRX96_020167 [Rhipicephalus microplus]
MRIARQAVQLRVKVHAVTGGVTAVRQRFLLNPKRFACAAGGTLRKRRSRYGNTIVEEVEEVPSAGEGVSGLQSQRDYDTTPGPSFPQRKQMAVVPPATAIVNRGRRVTSSVGRIGAWLGAPRLK